MKMNARVVALLLVIEVLLMVAAIDALNLCGVSLPDVAKCKPAVTPPPPPTPEPTAECCAVVAKADLKCLCRHKGLLPPLGIDPDLALQLPAKCKLNQTPPC